jgi:hypothetical protein
MHGIQNDDVPIWHVRICPLAHEMIRPPTVALL